MSFRKPCHMPFLKLVPLFALTVHSLFSIFLTDSRSPIPPSSILHPGFAVNLEVFVGVGDSPLQSYPYKHIRDTYVMLDS